MRTRALFLALPLVVFVAGDGAIAATHRTISNAPFAAQAHGLVGAVGVDTSITRSAADQVTGTSDAVGREARRMSPQLTQLVRYLRRTSHVNAGARLFVDRVAVNVANGRLVLPDLLSRAPGRLGNGSLTVTLSGWSTQDTARLQNFIAEVLPAIEQVYGKPASTITVTLLRDENLLNSTNPHEWITGAYNPSTNTIHMPPFGSAGADSFDLDREAEWNVTHMLLHAFHDGAVFAFDAWEEGFARAASIAVMAQLRNNFVSDVLRESPNWKGPNYEQQNQPELAAASFFNGFPWIAAQRLWAAPMAWLKVFAERTTFFRDFNQAYYAQLDPGATVPLSGNVPALKQLAAGLVPTVEGMPFATWFNQQHVLNSSVSTGRKFVPMAFPSISTLPGTTDLGYGVNLWLHYFETGLTGVETPLGGQVQFTYRNDRSNDLFAEEGNEAIIAGTGEFAGLGLHSPLFFNIGGPNRIEVDSSLGSFFRTLPYAHEVVGTVAGGLINFSDLSGAVLGAGDGTLAIEVTRGRQAGTVNANVTRGVFSVPAGTLDLSGPLRLTFTFTPAGGGPAVTFQRNLAYDYYVLQFRAVDSTIRLNHTFLAGQNGLHVMSVPLRPVVADEAAALGVNPAGLLLAKYRPRKVAGSNDPDRYELYPNITSRIGPGEGYILRVLQDTNVEVEGSLASNAVDFEIPLPSGFSIVGQPFNHQTDVNGLKAKIGNGTAVSLAAAQASGLLGRGLWRYSQAGGFELENTQLDPWSAYYLRVTNPDGLTLVIPPTPRSRATTRAAAGRGPLGESLPAGSWYFRLAAYTEGARDADNFIGVAPGADEGVDNAADIVQPPDFSQYVSLYFPHVSGRGDTTKLAADFRPRFAGAKTWNCVVETDLPNRDIRLAWGDLSSLPRELRPTLVDLDGGATRYMRTSAGYTFRSGPGRSRRRFQLSLDSSATASLRINAVTPTRGPQGYTVSFSVSAPALISAEIVSSSGRGVRALSSAGRAAHPGLNTLFWDLRDAQGRPVPRGVYLLRMIARDEQGRTFRAAKAIQVLR